MNCAKTAEPIEMQFGKCWVGWVQETLHGV